MGDLIFDDGFRANVGIVIFNKDRKVFFEHYNPALSTPPIIKN
jgi:hypothetical protein